MESQHHEQRVIELLTGSNVCLVGNSIEIMNHEKGKFIDSHEVVIRMGKGIPRPDKHPQIGRKMDIWATGFLRAEQVGKRLKGDIPKLLNRTRMNLDTAKNKHMGLEFDFHTMFSDDEIHEIYKEFGYQNNTELGRPSNGFIVLLWLIKKAWVWKSLTLIGFDFFAKSAPFKIGEMYPYSWHMPRNTVGEIPHNVPAEREYALEMKRNGIIKWEILSDLKPEILDD